MSKRLIHLVMAVRPNIMKVAPLYHALKATDWAEPVLVHTGQHYDDNMSGNFLRDFNLPAPHHMLNIGSGTYAEQTGKTMIAYEILCYAQRPDLCIVVGDVNATLACAITAKKLGIPVGHVEAGLRSFDRSMPEEINRIATDAVSDWFWTSSPEASAHLIHEGVAPERICEIGNIIIDTLCACQSRIAANDVRPFGDYAVATFHRPSNVDHPLQIERIKQVLGQMAEMMPVIFPVHPRTRQKLDGFTHPAINLCEPMSYAPFINLVNHARVVVTDSGGIQEETSYLGVPCLTLRSTTERPITITHGTNMLVSFDTVIDAMRDILAEGKPKRPVIPGWDGQAAARLAANLKEIFSAGPGLPSASRFPASA